MHEDRKGEMNSAYRHQKEMKRKQQIHQPLKREWNNMSTVLRYLTTATPIKALEALEYHEWIHMVLKGFALQGTCHQVSLILS